jgi:hypothetical protein
MSCCMPRYVNIGSLRHYNDPSRCSIYYGCLASCICSAKFAPVVLWDIRQLHEELTNAVAIVHYLPTPDCMEGLIDQSITANISQKTYDPPSTTCIPFGALEMNEY